ncbi:MAG: hypothetical protein R2856_19455 [Caldilineaceae bacterium]
MFGSGYIEMLARQITQDLQAIRDEIPPGAPGDSGGEGHPTSASSREDDGSWDVSQVTGIFGK